MRLFLCTVIFNAICTLTALLIVWAFEIASPVLWALILPAAACDLWRLTKPYDYGADQPRHPIWHDPNTPLWIFGAFSLCVLIAAPFLRFACFETLTPFLDQHFRMTARKIADAGGACQTRYGTVLEIYMAITPFFIQYSIIYFSIIFRYNSSIGKNKYFFKMKDDILQLNIFFGNSILLILFILFINFISFDHLGSRTFAPIYYIFSLLLFKIILLAIIAIAGLVCRAASLISAKAGN